MQYFIGYSSLEVNEQLFINQAKALTVRSECQMPICRPIARPTRCKDSFQRLDPSSERPISCCRVAKSEGYLKDAGLDMAAWKKCAGDTASEEYKAEAASVDADMAFCQSVGVTGTPGFFVNGTFLSGAQPISAFEPLIEAAKGGADS